MLKSSRNTYLLPLAIEPLNSMILPQISLLFLDTIINEWTILRPALSFLFLRWYLNVNCTFRGFSSSFREFPFNIFKEIGTLLLDHRWKARTFCKVFWLCSELGFLLDFNSGLREGEKKILGSLSASQGYRSPSEDAAKLNTGNPGSQTRCLASQRVSRPKQCTGTVLHPVTHSLQHQAWGKPEECLR